MPLVKQRISLFLLVAKHWQVEKRSRFFTIVFLILAYVTTGSSQQNISGVVNRYTKVLSIDGADRITVADASAFHPKDTTLIIQMKGVSINPSNSSSFGLVEDINQAGKYEFIIIDTILPGNQIVFTADLSTGYEPDAYVQLIRVPGYSNARVTGEITCQPWDSAAGTGGVVALLVGNMLTLDADIDVSGKGFAGGDVVAGNGDCSESDASYSNYYFNGNSDSAGLKGEGIASFVKLAGDPRYPICPKYIGGRGRIFTGGGGGNAKHSGGGGGAFYGSGGDGGIESSSCTTAGGVAGKGGQDLESGINDWTSANRIFLGSGGGSGTQSGGLTATAGGAGGGIIILMADTLVGNGHFVRADGESVSAVASAAGGGGGAGGMILLEIHAYKNAVTASVHGGAGGSTNGTDCSGPGGGGGGGIIWKSMSGAVPNLTTIISGGSGGAAQAGCDPVYYVGGEGDDGYVNNNLEVVLTGFLFNSIFSSRTGEYADTLCEGETIPLLLGSDPKGGVPPYDYQWQGSIDKVSWTDLAGETSKNLDLRIPLLDTAYYRRIVTDQSASTITDISKVLTIVVQPEIEQNRLQFDTIICSGQQPSPLVPAFVTPIGGDGTYAYVWEESTDGVTFTAATGTNDAAVYQPPVLSDTTWYRRLVYSGKCSKISDTVTITVLPLLGNNTVGADQTICEGSAFAQLTGTPPTGGDGSYTYEWVESTDGALWNGGYGPNTGAVYQPDTASPLFPGQVHFRRVVRSGLNNTCVDTSSEVLLIQYPAITNNDIAADQHICEGVVPVPLTGTAPAGGDGSYSYLWVESNNGTTFSPAAGSNTEIAYAPPALADTTYYQRVVVSNVCRDTSAMITITVDPAIRNYGIQTLSGGQDTTVCAGVPVNALVPAGVITGGDGSYVYNWQSSTDDGSSWSGTGGTGERYHPAPLATTTLFRRVVTSGMCNVISDTVTFTVLPPLTNNLLPADYAVCEGSTTLVDGTTPTGGNGTYTFVWQESPDAASWSDAVGSAAEEDYQTPVLSDTIYYRRIVYSGPANTCGDTTGSLQIGIYLLPSADLAPLDTTICSGNAVGLTVQVTGDGGPWDLEYADGLGHTATVNLTATTPVQVPVSPSADNAVTDYTYTLTALTDTRGCQALPASLTGQASVHVNGVPLADAGEDAEVCGMQYQLQGVQPSFGDALWLVPVGLTLSDTSDAGATATVSAEGSYPLTLQVSNGVCPVEEDNVQITFWQEPGDVTVTPDTTLEPGSREVDLEAVWQDPQVGTLTWSTPSPAVIDNIHSEQIHVTALSVGESMFRVEVVNGVCAVKADEVRVTVPGFTAHNYGISPNNDGINDKMTVAGAEHTPNSLVIFDVNGTMVFRTDNFMHADNALTVDGWEGVNNDNEPLPDGTYYYILEMKGDVQETMKGYIIIKRSTQ